MFLNITALKKILTNSYKSTGLTVGRLHHQLIVCNTCLGFQIDVDFVPNKLKGILAELIGDIPKEGEIYTYTKEGQQAEMELARYDFYERWRAAKDFVEKTPVILRRHINDFRLLQLNSSGRLIAVYREFVDLVSMKDLEETESMPGRPNYRDGILYWKNDSMIYFATQTVLKEDIAQILLPALEQFRFTEKTIERTAEPEEDLKDALPYR